MNTIEYYINTLSSPFFSEFQIPTIYLQYDDIIRLIYSLNWRIAQNNATPGWTTLIRTLHQYD